MSLIPKVVLPYGRSYNFSAGPASLPIEVLEQARDELLNFHNSGESVMEMSHRSKVYIEIFERARKSLRTLLNVPDNYEVLFLQGGATLMFSAVVLNLVSLPTDGSKPTVDYIVTGDWSKKAVEEAKLYSQFVNVNVAADGKPSNYTEIPDPSTWKLSANPVYVHYTTNETIRGVEFSETPNVPSNTVLVADCSSDFISKPIDVAKHGIIYAGAQKNAGPAGVTLVIVRKDLLEGRGLPFTPSAINFKKQSQKDSMLNTPPTYSSYVCGLYFDYLLKLGGLTAVQRVNEEKAKIIYDILGNSGGYYQLFVTNPAQQSRMNIPFRIWGGGEEGKDKMTPHETKFVSEATKAGLVNLKGYRDLGGIRISQYNALTLDGVKVLANFLVEFQKANPPKA